MSSRLPASITTFFVLKKDCEENIGYEFDTLRPDTTPQDPTYVDDAGLEQQSLNLANRAADVRESSSGNGQALPAGQSYGR